MGIVSTLSLLKRAHYQVVKEHLVCWLEDCDVVWKGLPDGFCIVAVKQGDCVIGQGTVHNKNIIFIICLFFSFLTYIFNIVSLALTMFIC